MQLTACLKKTDITSTSHVVLMLSGGIDSMVLLDLTHRFQKEVSFDFHLLHFNFHLRGEESNRDENFIRTIAHERGLKLTVVDCPLSMGPGIQLKARRARYDYLIQQSRKNQWTHALVAHHADDQAETVLMRIQRGANMRGLKGMDLEVALTPGLKLVRPLLPFSKETLSQYAKANRISHVEDSSNAKDAYFRNWIRHGELAQLKANDPSFLKKITTSCKMLQTKLKCYQQKAEQFIKKGPPYRIKDYFSLEDTARFLALEHLLHLHGFNKQVTSKHIFEVEELIKKDGFIKRAYGECILIADQDVFEFQKQQPFPHNWSMSVGGPGEYWIQPLKRKLVIKPSMWEKKTDGNLFVQKSRVKFPLVVRFPKPGDRFCPFGMRHSKKLQDFFVDRKISREKRRHSLVMSKESKIICLVPYEIDDNYRIQSPDCEAFEISLFRDFYID